MNGWFEGLAAPRPGRLAVIEARDLATPAEVWAYLAEHAGPGWVCTTDRVRRVPDADLGDAAPLSAEVAISADRSLHLRQHGTGWRAWLLEDKMKASGALPAPGDELAVDESFVSTEERARLCYRTWWRLQEEDGVDIWRPYASRFIGWEDA